MFFFKMNEVVSAAKIMHSPDIEELVEATTNDAHYIASHGNKARNTRDDIRNHKAG